MNSNSLLRRRKVVHYRYIFRKSCSHNLIIHIKNLIIYLLKCKRFNYLTHIHIYMINYHTHIFIIYVIVFLSPNRTRNIIASIFKSNMGLNAFI